MNRFLLAILSLAAFGMAIVAQAQTDLYVRGSGKQFPIALPRLCLQSGSSEAPSLIPSVISRDLDLSGYFEVLDANTFIETPGKCASDDNFAFSDWSVIGAEGVVRGKIVSDSGRIKVRLMLYNVPKQQLILGKEYEGDSTQIPLIAHKFANEILRAFTGEYGPFGSQIAFSSRVGRFKELFVMDMDGQNIRQLTNDRGLAVSPSWASDGLSLIFTSYQKRAPDLFSLDLFTRRQTQITRNDVLEIAPRFSRDGSTILVSRNTGKESGIVMLRRDGSTVRTISQPPGAIDVSPFFSPDETRIAFCSNRSGGPQIYTMNSNGTDTKRISFVTSNYCTSPSWSPRGDKIAFVCRADGAFQIFVSNSDGTNPLQLTSSGTNEDPEWSPDGRYLAFATTFGGGGSFGIAIIREDGTGFKTLTRSRSGDYDPSWGPVPLR